MNNTKVHIITGNPNTGKTTTAWLIYFLLKKQGTVEYFRSFHDGNYEILPEAQEPLDIIDTYKDDEGNEHAYDFCALVVVSHIRIAIFSAGDNEKAIIKGFEWLDREKPHVYVGCCRNSFNSYARCKLNEYEKKYNMSFRRLYYDNTLRELDQVCEGRMSIAEEMVERILDAFEDKRLKFLEDKFDEVLGLLDTIDKSEIEYHCTLPNDADAEQMEQQVLRVYDKLATINKLMEECRPYLSKFVA